MSLLRWIFIIGIQFITAGCFFNTAITSLNSPLNSTPNIPVLGKVSVFESVSGANDYSRTVVSGYLVKQTAGLLINKQMTSTPNGYRVYLNVNGRITSEEINQ